jgi:hypothetical protein
MATASYCGGVRHNRYSEQQVPIAIGMASNKNHLANVQKIKQLNISQIFLENS